MRIGYWFSVRGGKRESWTLHPLHRNVSCQWLRVSSYLKFSHQEWAGLRFLQDSGE